MSDTEASYPPLVLTFAASDPSGGAGMQADMLTAREHGLPSAVRDHRDHRAGFARRRRRARHRLDWVADQARRLLEDMPVDAFKIGVLGSVENIAAIAEIVSDYPDVPLIFDPVLASGAATSSPSDDMTHAMRELLLPQTTDPHAEQRRGAPARGRRRRGRARTLAQCAAKLVEKGCEYVLVTGTHENTPDVVNTLYGKTGIVRTDNWPRCPARTTAPAARFAPRSRRCSPTASRFRAVREAQEFTWQALRKAYPARHGPVPPRPPVLGARRRPRRAARTAEPARSADAH
jgi:hydroxymethylpyrimidine/phosphomethylpyrimidine kinase